MSRQGVKLDMSLTRANLLALTILSLLAMVVWAWQMAGRTWFVAALPVERAKVRRAQEQINPNTAGVASLRRLPGIGEVRARDIVQYRRKRGRMVFKSASDLTKIPGIGKGTVEKISPYLAPPNTWRDAAQNDE